MKKILIIVFCLFVLLYFFQLFKVAKNYSQSYRFGDEDAHMLAGTLISKGYAPYRDFSGNHQPFTYWIPAAIQKVAPANTLFPFVGRHRLAVYAYSIIWSILYLIVFGPIIFFFIALFEVLKYVLLGNKVLGEVWALYPFLFLIGIVVKNSLTRKKLSNLTIGLFSLSSFVAAFSLLPLWPSIALLNLYMLISNRKDICKIVWQLAPLIVLTVILFLFTPLNDYIQNTLIDNITYVIPKLNKVSTASDYLRMIFLPITFLYSQHNLVNLTVFFFFFFYPLAAYIFWRSKKILAFGVILISLMLSNNRSMALGLGDFHVLPWIAAFIFFPVVTIPYLGEIKKIKGGKNMYSHLMLVCNPKGCQNSLRWIYPEQIHLRMVYLASLAVLLVFSLWFVILNKTEFYGNILFNTHNDIAREHYINYSDSVKNGLGIKSIKKSGDRIFGIANDTLAIWVADGDLAIPPLESLSWQYELPRFRKQLREVFEKNPPEFFLMDDLAPVSGTDPVSRLIINKLKSDYVQINHLGKPSELYILKSKISEVSEKQWEEFEYYLFNKPSEQID